LDKRHPVVVEPSFPHPDLLPSNSRWNCWTRLSQLPRRLDTPTDRGPFSLSGPYLFSVRRALGLYTDFQSAVSPTCSRQDLGSFQRVGVSQRLAECNSAKQQSTTLRYDGALNRYSHPMGDDETTAVPSLKTESAWQPARKKCAFNGNVRVVCERS